MKLACVMLVGIFALTCCATKSEFDIESVNDDVLLSAGIDPEFHRQTLHQSKIEMMRAKALLEQLDSLMKFLGFDPDSYVSSFTQEEYDGFIDSYKLTIEYQNHMPVKERLKKAEASGE